MSSRLSRTTVLISLVCVAIPIFNPHRRCHQRRSRTHAFVCATATLAITCWPEWSHGGLRLAEPKRSMNL